MSTSSLPLLPLSRSTALVTGASRGLGRTIAHHLAASGARVVGISRTAGPLDEPAPGVRIVHEPADASDGAAARALLARYRPDILVLNAGAVPATGPIGDLSWDEFERNWRTDVRHVFEWISAGLHQPGSSAMHVIAMSSGAAVNGSPLSGGYAGPRRASSTSVARPSTTPPGGVWRSRTPACCPS